MASQVKLSDVAKHAGVSIGTASQALNNRHHVSRETRSRVLDAANRLGYQPRDGHSPSTDAPVSTIMMLAKHDYGVKWEINPFFSYIQLGIENECSKRGINLLTASIEVDSSNKPVVWPSVVQGEAIGGFVLIGISLTEEGNHNPLLNGRPVILVDSYGWDTPYDCVLIDNWQGVYGAVDYLVALNHRHIGLIGWNENAAAPGIHERAEAYRQALIKHGIDDCYIEPSRLTREEAREAALRLLQKSPQVTAILSCNDDTALGVLAAAEALQIKVPEELSVIGFDNIDLSRELKPALTTVNVPKTWMGTIGVRFLIDRITYTEQPRLTARVATQLIIRETTAPARRGPLFSNR